MTQKRNKRGSLKDALLLKIEENVIVYPESFFSFRLINELIRSKFAYYHKKTR